MQHQIIGNLPVMRHEIVADIGIGFDGGLISDEKVAVDRSGFLVWPGQQVASTVSPADREMPGNLVRGKYWRDRQRIIADAKFGREEEIIQAFSLERFDAFFRRTKKHGLPGRRQSLRTHLL